MLGPHVMHIYDELVFSLIEYVMRTTSTNSRQEYYEIHA